MIDMFLNQGFIEWLQAELDKRGWTQSDLARASNLSRAVINKLLNRKTSPNPHMLQAIARAFKIPAETVYRITGLLPRETENESYAAEIAHKLNLIKSPQRRKTALRLLKALINEEENENRP